MPFDEYGRQIPDLMPVAIPLGLQKPESQESLIKRIIRQELSMQAAQQGYETFEESLDFEIDDDPFPVSQYEYQEMVPDYPISEVESERQHSNRQHDSQGAGDNRTAAENAAGVSGPSGAASGSSSPGHPSGEAGQVNGS